MPDYYEILEVDPQATPDQILAQYHFLVQAWHPDKFAAPENKTKAEEKLKRINEAKTVLLDAAKRQEYDSQRYSPSVDIGNPSQYEPGYSTQGPSSVVGAPAPQTQPARTPETKRQPPVSDALLNILSLELAAGVVMEFVRVPAGEFLMGSSDDGQAYPDEQPQHKVYLQEYLIGKYLVTNRQYQAFLYATGHSHWEQGTVTTNKENHPVVSVSWQDALAFCEWVSTLNRLKTRLPSEAEWEKAARGANGRIYPWGSQPPENGLLNYNRVAGGTTKVGAYPAGASPYGALDMAGNAWEWVNDLYDPHYYANSPTSNPTGPQSGEYRVLRGGAWSSVARNVRTTNRLSNLPTDAGYASGFRCVRNITP